ncbi:MAG: ribosomal-processing cysteine protease Prp [Brevinematales bacterium]|nr:ribosomal-processing cysteine protease Prp [Brevinematales bacterium]
MISIKISIEKVLTLEASGHALFDKKGKDIVCAAVSTLLQSWLIGLEELCKVRLNTKKENGFLSVRVDEINENTFLLTQNLVLSLKILEKQYKENIKVELEEKDGSRWFR